jgi:hypothetical protein
MLSRLQQPYKLFHIPNVVRESCFHRWLHTERLMHADARTGILA